MYDLDKAYSKKFFAQRASLSWRTPIVTKPIMELLQPSSVIDVGCGNADILAEIDTSYDVKCFGIEGSVHALDSLVTGQDVHVFIRDLRKPLDDLLLQRADLAICFEVAEHLEPAYANTFVDNLCSLSDHILMTAAPPGQGGNHHVNCQPFSYWFHKFTERGYRHNGQVVDALRKQWESWKHKKGIKAYYNNLMYWERI